MFAKRLLQTCLDLRFVLRRNSVAAASTTIYALSSGRGKSGIAVVRVSGPDTGSVLVQLLDRRSLPQPRRASLRVVRDPLTKEKIDKGIVLWMPGPHTFTGEDLAELHIHGGQAVINAVLYAIGRVPKTRLAEPGEFTRRSFLNGKIDLTEAEGIADVIHAETEAQRRQAFRQMDGDLRRKFSDFRERLMTARAHLEAFIDFSEEEHLEPDILNKVKRAVKSVQVDLKECLTDNRRGERLRNGVHVTIVGEPNVGKSSLLNAICQKPTAIVSPIAGTTRDVVESAFDLGGYPVLLSDTAGLRETEDVIESEGLV
ncbi:hypothetical protein RvY_12698-3 [Ramazzottius varieornatus]|uniref:TrmE-type G domain-containing protein n=1 Tax=Ramazzottius varieornatus TaxID=947166 RepID=A0A1D1VU32_RAMVA|nr:hypothetical protein RvY_12698-3 [Ramazzottius varieornatus]